MIGFELASGNISFGGKITVRAIYGGNRTACLPSIIPHDDRRQPPVEGGQKNVVPMNVCCFVCAFDQCGTNFAQTNLTVLKGNILMTFDLQEVGTPNGSPSPLLHVSSDTTITVVSDGSWQAASRCVTYAEASRTYIRSTYIVYA